MQDQPKTDHRSPAVEALAASRQALADRDPLEAPVQALIAIAEAVLALEAQYRGP